MFPLMMNFSADDGVSMLDCTLLSSLMDGDVDGGIAVVDGHFQVGLDVANILCRR